MYIYTCVFHIFQKEPVLDAKKIRGQVVPPVRDTLSSVTGPWSSSAVARNRGLANKKMMPEVMRTAEKIIVSFHRCQ